MEKLEGGSMLNDISVPLGLILTEKAIKHFSEKKKSSKSKASKKNDKKTVIRFKKVSALQGGNPGSNTGSNSANTGSNTGSNSANTASNSANTASNSANTGSNSANTGSNSANTISNSANTVDLTDVPSLDSICNFEAEGGSHCYKKKSSKTPVSYTHLRAHETS